MSNHFVPKICAGERCRVCGDSATHIIGEEAQPDQPIQMKKLTAFICCGCFFTIFGPAAMCDFKTEK